MLITEVPRPTFDPRLQSSRNVFADTFGRLSDEEWTEILIRSIEEHTIDGVEFPTFPSADFQNKIHGHNGAVSIRGAMTFRKFVVERGLISRADGYLLDFGCGWGRITRAFLRDFPLKHIIGYEPDGAFVTLARAHNPFVTVFSGDFLPDRSLPAARFDLIVGWSVFSHLSEISASAWLTEIARVLAPGGHAVFTTWGDRFLKRLHGERRMMEAGEDIHWYSRVCIDAAGDIDCLIRRYQAGEFVWFTGGKSTLYGEAFLSEAVLRAWIKLLNLPLQLIEFDRASLSQDAFVLRRTIL